MNNCFTCAKSTYCLRCWMGYDNPNDFRCNDYETNIKPMTIDCNNFDETYGLLFLQRYKDVRIFHRGSVTYGTAHEGSDTDYGIIVPDNAIIIDVEGVFDNEKSDTRIHPCSSSKKRIDLEIIKEHDFLYLLDEHNPIAIEAIMLDHLKGFESFKIDPWKLRCKFGQIANNSWSKAKKKMTVKKDLDFYCGVKSLFHSIRLQMFAAYMSKGFITTSERSFASVLFNEIIHDWTVNNFTWEDFKEKYKPVYNYWHSRMVECCPKPEEEFKNNKK